MFSLFFFFQAEDGIRDYKVTGVQTCALPIYVDLYHYPEEQELARVALAYAEESYGVLERRFNHHPQRRVPLIIYASHSDFEQTNVLPFVPPEGLLGVTEFLRQRVALPFTGSYFDFRHTLR